VVSFSAAIVSLPVLGHSLCLQNHFHFIIYGELEGSPTLEMDAVLSTETSVGFHQIK